MLRNTCFSLLCALAAFDSAAFGVPVEGQPISFFRQFGRPGMDRAVAVAADATGIYLIGDRPPWQSGVRKYDREGNELWTREFSVPAGGAQVIGAAADGTGVYIIGYFRNSQGMDAGQFVRKYSAGGDESWTRQLDFSSGGGVAADATGVYVAFGGSLRKYSAAGDELWTSRLTGAVGVALDATGVYVLGRGSRNDTAFFFVRKWDLRGNDSWTRDQGGASSDRASHPEHIAAATPNGFFVAGGNGGSTFLRKYDAAGDQLWNRPIAASYSSLYIGGLAADETGVYVAGFTPVNSVVGHCQSCPGGDSFVRKYDYDGKDLWTRQFGTPDAAWASGITVDASGVYVAGTAGTALLANALYLNIFPASDAGRAGFLAKFDKMSAVFSGSAPRIFPDCIVNAASYIGGGVAPGEILAFSARLLGRPIQFSGELLPMAA